MFRSSEPSQVLAAGSSLLLLLLLLHPLDPLLSLPLLPLLLLKLPLNGLSLNHACRL
jgi:hypothetical protein